jgi:hypothetical protein
MLEPNGSGALNSGTAKPEVNSGEMSIEAEKVTALIPLKPGYSIYKINRKITKWKDRVRFRALFMTSRHAEPVIQWIRRTLLMVRRDGK